MDHLEEALKEPKRLSTMTAETAECKDVRDLDGCRQSAGGNLQPILSIRRLSLHSPAGLGSLPNCS